MNTRKKRTQCKTKCVVLIFSPLLLLLISLAKAGAKLMPCFLQSLSTSVSLVSSSRPGSRVFALATRSSLRFLTLVSTAWSTACTLELVGAQYKLFMHATFSFQNLRYARIICGQKDGMAKEGEQGKQGTGRGRHARGKVNWGDVVAIAMGTWSSRTFLNSQTFFPLVKKLERSEWIVVRGGEGRDEDGNPGPSFDLGDSGRWWRRRGGTQMADQ